MSIPEAPIAWDLLKGLVCLYKPAEVTVRKMRNVFINKICQELNTLEGRPLSGYVDIEGNPSDKLTVTVKPNLADHPLVVGPRYQEQDLPVSWSNYLGFHTSGVILFGVRSGTKHAKYLRENRPTRAYRVKGLLGQVTDNCYKTGKVVHKSTWRHVRRQNMDKFLSAMQASHQKKMFEMCGVDLQSQTAYELAVQGLIRPANSKIPILYGIKCIEFEPPEFTLEIQCINEYEDYLCQLIHEIAQRLHSTAHCTGIQCIRHSRFTLEHALLMKHWNLTNILQSMEYCRTLLKESGDHVPRSSAKLVE
ncbi:pseudouridylate synthase TRUB2, mitochondrial [Anthonomus grandis grandis]|uniref:pseudouridylate synthase TRUB2, mitochondrial n=1 Tax=Anthonomus grandis grandis TaxID=2921223 RepID=UPI0021658DCB|nr:pseudouridylate synthase TRUB2, mitochondrial [Anthonomus grandis grandis]